ncbi:MAG TPA: zinc-ribbon domain-containing protein [bacterium]|nr:zinc-ribbon domain-containing protein [bacterium]
MAVPEQAFCGECGAPLEPSIKFCGNCGAPAMTVPPVQPTLPPSRPVAAGVRPVGVSSAPPPPPVGARADRFCPECGATTKPNQQYCRICGTNLP